MTKPPAEITVAQLEVVVMPNGEIICAGKSLAWVTELGKYITVPEVEDPTTLGTILRRAVPHDETRLQILDVAGPDACISKITLSKKLRGASLLTFATENVTPGEVMNPETARFVGVVVWVPRALWPR